MITINGKKATPKQMAKEYIRTVIERGECCFEGEPYYNIYGEATWTDREEKLIMEQKYKLLTRIYKILQIE